MGVMEQTVTLQDGARDNVVVVFGAKNILSHDKLTKTNKAAENTSGRSWQPSSTRSK